MPTLLHLTPHDHGRPLTLEEFEHCSGEEGYRYELIDGRLDVSPLPDLPHDDLCYWLTEKLREYSRQHAEIINRVHAPARVFVPGRRRITTPEADVAAYRDFPLHLPRGQLRWQDVSPLLVIEVLSADSADKDLQRNVDLYLQVPSIREYWIVDPRLSADQPSMIVHRRRGQRWQNPIEIAAGETYSTRLLPDFSLIFARRG
jgi:Uma2 family endonuclease